MDTIRLLIIYSLVLIAYTFTNSDIGYSTEVDGTGRVADGMGYRDLRNEVRDSQESAKEAYKEKQLEEEEKARETASDVEEKKTDKPVETIEDAQKHDDLHEHDDESIGLQ